MFLTDIRLMAKKVSTKKLYKHKECEFCKEVNDAFLDYRHNPILGRCDNFEYMFLLDELTDCKKINLKS